MPKKNSQPFWFLVFIFLTHGLVFLVAEVTLTYISVGMFLPVLILLVMGLKSMPRLLAGSFVSIVIGANLLATLTPHQSIFKVQPGMNLADERRVVERTYEIAAGREFSINTVTNPYLYPTLWAFLYQKHQKVPYYRGITTYDFAGENVFPQNSSSRLVEFSIIEPEVNLPIKELGANRQLINTERIGEFELQTFVPLSKDNL